MPLLANTSAEGLAERLWDFWKGYRRNKGAVFGLLFLIILVTVAVSADWITEFGPMDTGVGRPLQATWQGIYSAAWCTVLEFH